MFTTNLYRERFVLAVMLREKTSVILLIVHKRKGFLSGFLALVYTLKERLNIENRVLHFACKASVLRRIAFPDHQKSGSTRRKDSPAILLIRLESRGNRVEKSV